MFTYNHVICALYIHNIIILLYPVISMKHILYYADNYNYNNLYYPCLSYIFFRLGRTSNLNMVHLRRFNIIIVEWRITYLHKTAAAVCLKIVTPLISNFGRIELATLSYLKFKKYLNILKTRSINYTETDFFCSPVKLI